MTARRNGLLAITPLFLLIVLFVGYALFFAEMTQRGLLAIFCLTSLYALAFTKGLTIRQRGKHFLKGATHRDLLLMVWIFLLAGIFSSSAKSMGSANATVDMALHFIPAHLILGGLFMAACFISLSMGTSVGTIAALMPVAAGVADRTGMLTPLVASAVVGGAFFGDNLSFISDTTVVATRTQGCLMRDKFRVNVRLVIPAALMTLAIYMLLGRGASGVHEATSVEWVKVMPYLAVLVLAVSGINVIIVLLTGCLLTGGVGLLTGDFSMASYGTACMEGILGMLDLIAISMLAGGLLNLVKRGGGITYIIRGLTRHIHTKRGAELTIAGLVSFTNLCTANNTVAILSVGNLAAHISDRYRVDKRKSASLLDTFSCCVQALLPYGAQLLIASQLLSGKSMQEITPMHLIPFLFYPLLMGLTALLAIFFRYPRKFS